MIPTITIRSGFRPIPARCFVFVAALLDGNDETQYVVHWESASEYIEHVRNYALEWGEGYRGYIAEISATLTPVEQLDWQPVKGAETYPLFQEAQA